MERMIAFWLHPFAISSVASQSSSAGCDGGDPWVPKSSLVSTMPRPKSCSQSRLTATRATSGLFSSTSHRARPSRFAGRSSRIGVQRLGRAGVDARASGGKAAAFAQLVRRPLERRPLTHDQGRGNLEIDQLLPRGRQRRARWREQGRAREEERGQIRGVRLAAVGSGEVQHRAQPRRQVGADQRIGGGRQRQAETSEALADRAVEMLDANREPCSRREAERRLRDEHRMAGDARRVANRGDRPGPALSRVDGSSDEQVLRLERRPRSRRPSWS